MFSAFISFSPTLMKHLIASILKFAATSAFLFAFVFEGQTGLGANYEANRALIQERVRLSQTANGKTNEQAVVSNMTAIEQYDQTLKSEYRVYGCDSASLCR